jgi:hypothetical protein
MWLETWPRKTRRPMRKGKREEWKRENTKPRLRFSEHIVETTY